MTKTRLLGSIALTVCLLAIIFTIVYFWNHSYQPQKHSSAIYFVETRGQIYVNQGEEMTVQLFCYGDKENPFLQEGLTMVPIQTDNENINIVESNIDTGSTYKGVTIFSIFFTVESGQPGSQEFTQVILTDGNGNEKTFEIGKVNIETVDPNPSNAIDIVNHLGGADYGAPYSFSFKNGASKPCTITGIDFGSLTSSVDKTEVTVNGNAVDTRNNIVIQPGDQVLVESTLNGIAKADIFLIAAKIRYRMLGDSTEYSYYLPYGTIGLPVSEESFQELSEKYINN